MNYITTKSQANDVGSRIVKQLRSDYGVPQSLLDDLAACAEVLEGRKDHRERRVNDSGRSGRRAGDRRRCACPACA